MRTNKNVRPATLADIEALNNLIADSARELSKGFYSEEEAEGAITDIFGVDTQLIEDQTYLIVEIDDELVGCGGWSQRKTLFGGDQMKDEADPLLDPETEPARIRAFFVHPHWARRGIGGMLMRACEDAAREAGFKALELVATLPGEPLYLRYGFVEIRRYEVPMSNGVALPVVSMRKKLS